MRDDDAELDELLEPEAAACLLGVRESTLRRWRRLGHGPRFVRTVPGPRGHVRYTRRLLQEWAAGRVEAPARRRRPGRPRKRG